MADPGNASETAGEASCVWWPGAVLGPGRADERTQPRLHAAQYVRGIG
jgi:hypothetical protein